MSPYAVLNPFTVTSVGENDLWNATSFPDVPFINSAQFLALKTAVEQVRAQRRTQVRFIRGAGGSGKSHLFARLHRESEGRLFYAYAPNPPLQPEALEQFILSRFVSSLRHPVRGVDAKAEPYSQLRLLAYALLKPVVEQDLTLPELHEAWAKIPLETRKEMIHEAVQLLEADHPAVPRSVLRCLLNILREDKEHLAAQWLSGAAYLTEHDLQYLGVPQPLQRAEMGVVIQLFGRLAAQAGAPVVLVLDQLDLLVTQPQFDEMQRLLFELIDQSENWLILIGMVAERFSMWDAALSQALRGRVGVPDAHAPLGFRLPVLDMLPLVNEQKLQLLACRLDLPELRAQRAKDGITSPIHPLLEEDITRLTAGGAIFPRHLLGAAAEAYALRVMDEVATPVMKPPTLPVLVPPAMPPVLPPPLPAAPSLMAVPVIEASEVKTALPELPAAPVIPSKIPLAAKVDALLQQAIHAAQSSTTAAESAIDLGERVRDLIELMAAPPVTISEGGIGKTYENFDGSDRWLEWGGGKIRIVTSNAVRGSFIAVLERVKEAAGDTLLLRHEVAQVSGQLSLELLKAFKLRNVFHHLSAVEAGVLNALGSMLAAQREGSYEQFPTEPPATKEHVLAALRQHPRLRGLPLWEHIQKVHAPKPSTSPAPPPPSVLSAIARPQGPAAKPPVPVARPPLPKGAISPPPARPAMPVAKPPAPPTTRPAPGAPRPQPFTNLPPPSQDTAA
jgi:hypothetical protein